MEDEYRLFSDFTNAVRQARFFKGQSLTSLSSLTGIDPVHLAFLEAGAERPVVEHVAVARALDVDLQSLHPKVPKVEALIGGKGASNSRNRDLRTAFESGLAINKRVDVKIHFVNGRAINILLPASGANHLVSRFSQSIEHDQRPLPICVSEGVLSKLYVRLDDVEAIVTQEPEGGAMLQDCCAPNLGSLETKPLVLFKSARVTRPSLEDPVFNGEGPYENTQSSLDYALDEAWVFGDGQGRITLDCATNESGSPSAVHLDLSKVSAMRIPRVHLRQAWHQAKVLQERKAPSECYDAEISAEWIP